MGDTLGDFFEFILKEPSKIDKLTRDIEVAYEKVIVGPEAMKTEAGTVYLTCASTGPKAEGADIDSWAESPELAMEYFFTGFLLLFPPQRGWMLVWRKKPKLLENYDHSTMKRGYAVIARACVEPIA